MRLRISDLELKFDSKSNDYGYFEVDTSDLTGSKLNDTQQKFAEVVYGSMEKDNDGNSDYSRAMEMLTKEENIKKTRIYSLRKETILRDAKESAVARACWLYYLDDDSNFIAYDWSVDYDSALRGVRLVGEADSREEISPIRQAYNTILNTPVNKLQAEATTDVIERMLMVSANYVKAQKQ